jgi:hypothetical protein
MWWPRTKVRPHFSITRRDGWLTAIVRDDAVYAEIGKAFADEGAGSLGGVALVARRFA